MKKILVLILCLSLKTAFLQAQTPEPTFMGSDKSMRRDEILKLEMKDDLKIYDKRFDSVLSESKRRRLRAAGLDDAAIKRVEDYYLRREKQMQR